MPHPIAGVLPVLNTPFDERDRIDRDSLRREIDWAFEVGADGVCSAMVSELLRLSAEERHELTHLMIEMTADRGAAVVSVGAESTKGAVQYARQAERAGCDAVMAIPPVSSALPPTALWEYFAALAEAVQVPLIVQDASSYVGQSLPTELLARLLERYGADKIMFKPEGAPIGPNLSALREATGGRARLFDGSGGILLVDAYRRGIAGTMPGVDLLDGIVALWRALGAGDEQAVYRLYFPVCALVALQLQAGLDGFVAIEKYILVRRGIFSSARRRMPFGWSLDEETRSEVDRLLERLERALVRPQGQARSEQREPRR